MHPIRPNSQPTPASKRCWTPIVLRMRGSLRKGFIWALIGAVGLSTDPAAAAQPAGASDDPQRLHQRVQALEEALELMGSVQADTQPRPSQSVVPKPQGSKETFLDVALILDAAAAWFSNEGMQTGAHDPPDTGFHLQQLEMSLGEKVDHLFELRANLVFSAFGVEVEEAYGRTLAMPGGLQLRAGQFLTRMGRLNPTHPHSWSFVDQPIANGTLLGSEGSRGAGVELSWLSPLPWYVEVTGSATAAGGECCAKSFLGANDLGVNSIGDFVYTVGLRQFFDLSSDLGLAWGLTTQQGPNATGNGNRTEIYLTDLYLRYRPVRNTHRMALSWTLEGMLRRRQIPRGLRVDAGGYTQLVWRINKSWETGARYGYVTGSPDDDLVPEATDDRHRVSAQVTHYPSHFSRLRLQGSVDRPLYRDEPIYVGLLAIELLVGAHGAHAY